jgi:hypothetical protein
MARSTKQQIKLHSIIRFINKVVKQDAGTPLVNGTYKKHASHLQSRSPALNRNTKTLAKYTTLAPHKTIHSLIQGLWHCTNRKIFIYQFWALVSTEFIEPPVSYHHIFSDVILTQSY